MSTQNDESCSKNSNKIAIKKNLNKVEIDSIRFKEVTVI